jgi:hypothetical protein
MAAAPAPSSLLSPCSFETFTFSKEKVRRLKELLRHSSKFRIQGVVRRAPGVPLSLERLVA